MDFARALSAPQVIARLPNYGIPGTLLLQVTRATRGAVLATGAGRPRTCSIASALRCAESCEDALKLCRAVVAAGASLDVDVRVLEWCNSMEEHVTEFQELAVPVCLRCDDELERWAESCSLINKLGMRLRAVAVDSTFHEEGRGEAACSAVAECLALHADTVSAMRIEPFSRELSLHAFATPVLPRLQHLRSFRSWYVNVPDVVALLHALPAHSLRELSIEYPGAEAAWLPAVRQLTRLERLLIVGADFEPLSAEDCRGALRPLQNLQRLSIIASELQDPTGAVLIQELPRLQLEHLDLEENLLAELTREALSTRAWPRLHVLNLCMNQMTALPCYGTGGGASAPRLRRLDVSNNRNFDGFDALITALEHWPLLYELCLSFTSASEAFALALLNTMEVTQRKIDVDFASTQVSRETQLRFRAPA